MLSFVAHLHHHFRLLHRHMSCVSVLYNNNDLVDKAFSVLNQYNPHHHLSSLSSFFTLKAASTLLLKCQHDKILTLKFLKWAHGKPFFDSNMDCKCIAIHILTKFKLFKMAETLSEGLILSEDSNGISVFECLKSTYDFCHSTSSVFDLLIRSYARLNLINKALRILDLVKSHGFVPGVLSYNSILDAVFRSNSSHDVAESVYEEMMKCRISLNVYSYNILIRGFCAYDKMDRALLFLDEMEKNGCYPNVITFNTLLDAYCKLGMIDKALNLLQVMSTRELKPNLITYNTVINGLCREGYMDKTKDILVEMSNRGMNPDRVTYNTLVNGYCKEGNVHQALFLHDEMIRKGIPPNVVTYTALIDNMCKAGNLTRAMDIMGQMQERGLEPNEMTYTTLIDGFSKQGFLDNAFLFFRQMVEDGLQPSVTAYNSLINGYCLLGKIDKASELLQDMERVGLVPDLITYSTIIHGLCGTGDLDKAFELNERMVEKGILPDCITYSSLIHGLCQQNRLREAFDLFKKMITQGLVPDEFSYTTLINGYCKLGDVNRALNLHDEMLKLRILPDIVTYNVLINGLRRQARTREAKQLLFRLFYTGTVHEDITYDTLVNHSTDVESKSVVSLMKGFCMKGLMNEADRVFQLLLDKSAKPNEAAYNVLIHGHCKGGSVWKALELYNEMLLVDCSLSAICALALIRRLSNEGLEKELNRVIHNILDSCLLSDAEQSKVLIETNLEVGNMETVFTILSEMAKDGFLPGCRKR